MSDTIEINNGQVYIKKGDKLFRVNGGGSAPNIITADSVDELPDPATVPEGTVALVTSEE